MFTRIVAFVLIVLSTVSVSAMEPQAAPAGSIAKVSVTAPSADEVADAVSADLGVARKAFTRIQAVDQSNAPDAKEVKAAAIQYEKAFGRAIDKVEVFRTQGADTRMAESDVNAFMRDNDKVFQKVIGRVPEEAKGAVLNAQACHGKGRALGHKKAKGKGHVKGKGKGHQKYDDATGSSLTGSGSSGKSSGGQGQGRGRSGK